MKVKGIEVLSFFALLVGSVALSGCDSRIDTPSEVKYLSQFHDRYQVEKQDPLRGDELALYVDYSTCIARGMSSPFYNAVVPSLVNTTRNYYSIKGDSIRREIGAVYTLLNSVQEVNYADLQSAANRMAEGKGESVLLTDGEYFQLDKGGSNINNPYLAPAFKKWLLRGHDIYILSEPYVELYKGSHFAKKRFYILFTDSRLPGNIYERIKQTVNFGAYAGVEEFHLSVDHPSLRSYNGQHSQVNPALSAQVKGYGTYEVHEWSVDWKNGIEPLIVSAADSVTGEPLPSGDYIVRALTLDRKSLGMFDIKELEARVYNLNAPYAEFVDAMAANSTPTLAGMKLNPVPNFIILDNTAFTQKGEVVLRFDTPYYNPDCLDGSPYNYQQVDLCVKTLTLESGQLNERFSFESIDIPGRTNVSVAASIHQCMADADVQARATKYPIYTIYIQSPQR